MADEPEVTNDGETPPPGDASPAEPDEGKGGKAAILADLASERDRRQQAEQRLAELERAQLDDNERAIAEARDSARAEVLGEVNSRLVAAEVRAAAAQKVADPADAVALLDLTKFTPADDGTFDTAAISAAVDQLVVDKPYLAASPTPQTRPLPGGGNDRGQTSTGLNSWLRGGR